MSQKTVETMKQWIVDNITSEIRLEQMAAYVGYSPYYCSVKFHEAVGMTYRQYHSKIKLERAKRELEDRRKKVIDIAVTYGFHSHEAFSRAFRKIYGMAPSRYRSTYMEMESDVYEDDEQY